MTGFTSGVKVGRKIGNGHFGQVHEALDPAHGDVAVKILRRGVTLDDANWANYKEFHLGEAKRLSRAEHRNVVKVHYVVEGDGGDSVAICMAFCPGGSLQEQFERGPMTLSEVKRVGTQVLHGLGALHQRGMLHRDIKPANILIDADAVAQLGDFGLVTDDLVLGYGSQAGYSDHIAYEVWNGVGTSAKSDIWALGMTLYRLLHGKTWYDESPDPRDLVRHGGFADTLRWLPHVPKDWRRVIRKMLADDTAKRFQSAQQALNGIAPLSVEPAWETKVADDLIEWQRTKGQRRLRVEWKRLSARKHEWRAWSEPLKLGRDRSLGQSKGIVGRHKAETDLRDFLCG
ncbi:serine/threonine-protein kinase [Citromicrobium bathyomarinum]|uniref:serine/threonine-protein kinase n=1 Tax=Citromicrobium bathyomarinum TaxID=72174 RepID=UPI001E563AC5|nr:serine/threonine-protein kinase [Citromicrobium bathyomarinum]MCD1622904.1 serine/threonine protein kinase [Citromicrobium bathyomarinum]